ncbi:MULTISPECIES: heavy metal-binding domain-containing protein [Aquidulcibacter]|uniref:heavy metal-binding domain-containing protein n=1 Tax=Aquidulcibacter TaxID=2052989 RepID=UPI000A18D1E5|nr:MULTISPECIES: heavy metal-binding domain-containing protein [Aquidulcibacter]MCA3692729.1 heavy metal-binding domain-containing protein [Aquidulcibacter sp.]
MIVTTTDSVEGRKVTHYLGVVAGEAVIGANVFRDLFAGIRDVIGGRSGAYEKTLREARQVAIDELMIEAKALGADAVIGVSIDFEGGVHQGTMMMVAASGTAVRLG